jgi:hypothetical protein
MSAFEGFVGAASAGTGHAPLPIGSDPIVTALVARYPLHCQFSRSFFASDRAEDRAKVEAGREWLATSSTGWWAWREASRSDGIASKSIGVFIERESDQWNFEDACEGIFRREKLYADGILRAGRARQFPDYRVLNQAILCGVVRPYGADESLAVWLDENAPNVQWKKIKTIKPSWMNDMIRSVRKRVKVGGYVRVKDDATDAAFRAQWQSILFHSMKHHHFITPAYTDPMGPDGAIDGHPEQRVIPKAYRDFLVGRTNTRPGF